MDHYLVKLSSNRFEFKVMDKCSSKVRRHQLLIMSSNNRPMFKVIHRSSVTSTTLIQNGKVMTPDPKVAAKVNTFKIGLLSPRM